MREIYQQTVEEVLDHVESRESGLASERLKDPERSVDGMSLQKERKKVFYRFSLSSIRIFWC